MVRISKAANDESCGGDAIQDASSLSIQDAEKGAHRLFKIWGLALDVPVSWVQVPSKGELLKVPFLKVSAYLQKFVSSCKNLAFASDNPQRRCLSFWKGYFQSHPSHQVFARPVEQLAKTIPLCMRGDEGTGSKKQPVSIVSWQTVWGLQTPKMTQFSQRDSFQSCPTCPPSPCRAGDTVVPEAWPGKFSTVPAGLSLTEDDYTDLKQQFPTTAGHSFLTRHLTLVLPTYLVSKGPHVLEAMMEAVAEDLLDLFHNGVFIEGAKFWVAVIGLKGDAKWHASQGKFIRSHARLGSVSNIPMCPSCLAGHEDHPFEDVTGRATWISTMFTSDPWDAAAPGPMERIPFDSTAGMAAMKYRKDPLHVFKLGLGRDVCGSSILMLSQMFMHFDYEAGDSKALENRLRRAHGRFAMFASANGISPHLRGFTKDFVHVTHVHASYPWTNSKASDTMALLRWLCLEYSCALKESPGHPCADLLKVGRQVCAHSVSLFQRLYSHGLWLPRHCVGKVRDDMTVVARGYSFLATACLRQGFAAWALKSTLHSFHHFLVELDLGLKCGAQLLISPLAFDCSQCEDFIGRTARVARSTHSKTTALRCLQRHLVKTKLLLRKPLKLSLKRKKQVSDLAALKAWLGDAGSARAAAKCGQRLVRGSGDTVFWVGGGFSANLPGNICHEPRPKPQTSHT